MLAIASIMGEVKVRSIDSLGDYLREQRRNAELSVRQLAERAGVSNPYLSQVERGLRKPSAEVLSQLARALSVSAEVMYVRAGLLDPDEDGDDGVADGAVARAIQADPHLAERHKRVLLEIYESFRQEQVISADVQDEQTEQPEGLEEEAEQRPASQAASPAEHHNQHGPHE